MDKIDRALGMAVIDWLQFNEWAENLDPCKDESRMPKLALEYIAALKEENKKLRDALEFYADEKSWYGHAEVIVYDDGREAREALK